LCRAHSARRQTCRASGRAIHQIRIHHQSANRKDLRRANPAHTLGPRRRGDRVIAKLKRRAFITLLGGAAAWPLAARAQQSSRMRRVGVLMGLTESDPEAQSRIAAFRKTLQGLGWTEGRDLRTDYYWAAGDVERTHALAKELASSAPDVIVVNTPPGLS